MQNKNFTEALALGHIQPVMLQDGTQFEVDGMKFYMPAESGAKMTITRFHSALDILRAHEELKLSYELNVSAWDQVKDMAMAIMASGDAGQIKEIAADMLQLQRRIDSRMKFGRDIEQIYEITAVYFITDQEDPGTINEDIVKAKIKAFKNKPELYSFFLSLPLSSLANLSTVSDFATLNYLKELNMQEILDLRVFLLKSSIYGGESDMITSISSRMETLKESLSLINSLSKNITTP